MKKMTALHKAAKFCFQQILLVLVLITSTHIGWAQTTSTWTGSSGGAWLTAGNWSGGAPNATTAIASFGGSNTATTVGLNTNTQSSTSLAAITFLTGTSTVNLAIGNSGTTGSGGTITCYGTTLNSTSNTIFRSTSAYDFTFQNNVGTGTKTLGLVLGNTTDNVVLIDGAGDFIVSSIISGSGKLTKAGTGAGVMTISGANSYTGGTTLTSGSLVCGAASTLPNSGTITFNGGTLSTGASAGFTQSTSTLTLANSSTIALGTGIHSLTFTASSGVTWTSGKTLTITGWTGTINGGTTGTAGKVFVGASAAGLTCTQLAQVKFLISGTNYSAAQLSTGELVPVNTPTVTSISPTSATAGGSSFTLTVNGTNFISGLSTVTWNGATRATTYASATQLTATILAADIASSGTATVGVTTGCLASGTQTFTINPSCTTPSTAITGTTSGCGTVSLTATGATTYTWSTGNSTSTAANTFTTLGTYVVTVTGYNGICSASASTTITVANSATSIAPTATQNITAGVDGVDLTVTRGSSSPTGQQWKYSATSGGPYTNISGATSTTYTPNFATAGTYYVVCVTTYGSPCSNTVTSNEVRFNVTNNAINTGTISGSPFCQGTTGVNVPFTYSSASAFPAGSCTFTAQLSDASGSFASYTTLQSVTSNGGGSQSISVTIPAGAAAGTGYNIRVVSTSPTVTGNDNGVPLTITANPTLSISGTTTACATVSLTATGTGTTYLWSGGSSTGTATNAFTSSGTYTVTATLSGCTATASAAVTVNPNPAVSVSGTTPGCTSVTLTASGTGTSYAWTGGSTPSAASNTFSASGTYTVTATLGSCTATASQTIVVNTAPTTTNPSTTPQTVCAGTAFSPTSVSVTGTNATGYQWYVNTANNNTTGTLISGANTNSYTLPATVGTYFYYCVVSGNSPCASVTSNPSGAITVNAIPADPTGSISASANPSCGAATLTYSAPSASIYWQTAAGGTSTTSPTTSTYSLAATNPIYARTSVSGCWSTNAVSSGTVTINAAPTTTNPSTTAQTVCAGTAFSPTSVSVTGTNATAYQWYVNTVSNNTTGTLISGATTNSYTLPVTVGTYYYYCVVSGNSPCASVTSNPSGAITVNPIPATPTGTASASANPSCGAATLSYTPSSSSIYWETSNSATSTASPSTATYSLASTGTIYLRAVASGCWSVAQSFGPVTINTAVAVTTQPSAATVNAPNTATFTIAGSGTIAGYQWEYNTGSGWSSVPASSPYSGTTTATLTVTPTSTAMSGYQYRCIIKGTAPCADVTTSAATLTVNVAPCASETFSNLCTSSCSPAAGTYGTRSWTGDNGFTWTATDSRSDQTITSTAILIRSGTLTSSSVAGGIGSLTMSTKLPFSDAAGSLSVTVNGTSVGTIPYTTSGTTTTTISGINTSGNIVLVVTSTGARVVIDDLSWTCYTCTTPTLSTAAQSAAVCSGSTATINLTGLVNNSSGNTINYTINGVAQTAVTGVNASATGTASFTTRALTTADNGMSLVITGITNAACSATFTTATSSPLVVNAIPATPTFTGSTSGCNSVSLTAASTAGSTYAWSGGSTPSAATNTFTSTGTYTVTATLSGCSASASQAFTVTASPTATITGTTTGCTSVSLTASGGTSYSWSGGSSSSTAANTFTTSGTYTVTVTNSCGTATASANVTVNTPPATPTITGTTTACSSVTLTAASTAGSTYAWSGGSAPGAATNTFTASGTYTVTATRNGCTATASQAVTVNAVTSITTQPANVSSSVGGSATFTVVAAGAGLTYQWMKGGVNISGATSASYTISPLALTDAGSYSVLVSGTCGPSVTTSSATLTVVNFTYRAGDYRSTSSATTLASNNSSTTTTNNWEYYDGTSWGPTPGGKAPANATTTPTRVIVAPGTFVDGAGNNSKSYHTIIVQSNGWLDLAATGTASADFIPSGDSLEILSGGFMSIEGQISINSGGKFIIRAGGEVDISSSYISNTHVIWQGTENFEPGSIFYVDTWGYNGGGSGSLYNGANISSNATGYKFGILTLGVNTGTSDWTLVGGGVTINLCDTLNVSNSSTTNAIAMTSNLSSPNVTVRRINHKAGTFGLTAVYSGTSTAQTVNILENLTSTGGTLKLFYNGGGVAGGINVNLAGHLTIGSTTTVNNDATTSTGAVLNFNGTATQYVDATPTVTAWPMNILSGATVALRNHDLTVNGFNSLTTAITVKSGSTLDFGFAADNVTANVIKKVTSGAVATNSFTTEQNTTLKITSPNGIQLVSATLGNVQLPSNKTYNQLATFWYTGHANQVTGDGLGTTSNGKQIIIDLLNKSLSVTLTQSTALTNGTTVYATGGKLDIRTGQFLETATAYITGSTGALTMAAGTLYQIPALSASSTDVIPRMDGSLAGGYTLPGGTIELSGAGAQTLRGSRTYFNVKYSGSNIYGTNYKNLSTGATINDSLIITGTTTVVNCVDGSSSAQSFSGNGGLVMDGGRLMIKNLNTTQPALTGTTIPYSLTGGTVEFYGSNTTTQQIPRGTDGNGNTISYYNVDVNADGANTAGYNANPSASFGLKGTLNVYSPAVFQLDETENISGVGNFTVNAGATFKYASPNGIKTSGTGTSDGNLRITGTRSLSTAASYGFVGNGDMVSGNGLPSSMVNMYIQKTGTNDIVTLTSTATATGTIAFTKGRISTGTNELVSNNTATTSITGHGLSKYVIGNLRRYVAGSGSYDFPLGNTSYYDLGTINFNSQAGVTSLLGYFTTGQSGTAPAAGTCQINDSKIVDYLNNGFWTFTPNSTMTGGTYDVTLNAMGYTNAPSQANRMGVIKRANASAAWLGCGKLNRVAQPASYGTHSSLTQSLSGGVATALRSGVTGFSDFAIGLPQIDRALPVTLMYLTATPKENETITLDWATASEINNNGFQIERSTNGESFDAIAWVEGNGNSNATIKYTIDDKQVAPGTIYYYRLKQVDYDGKYEYSNIVSAALNSSTQGITIHNVHPNPASAQVTIDIVANDEQAVSVSFTDMLGQEVLSSQWQLSAGYNDRKYDISSLAAGVYHVTVRAGNSFFTKVLAVTR